MAIEASPVILFEGGDVPDGLAYRAAKLGVEACPNVEFLDVPAPRVLMGPLGLAESAFANNCRGFIEFRAGDQSCPLSSDLVQAVAAGGLCLSVSTSGLLGCDLAQVFCAAVCRMVPGIDTMMMELAVAEAVGNAIIHGNLGLRSDLRHSLAGLVEFNQRIAERSADPTLSARRVRLTAVPLGGGGVEVCVTDDGDGFDLAVELAKPLEIAAKSGRGLGLIRKVSSHIRGDNHGRSLYMVFAPID